MTTPSQTPEISKETRRRIEEGLRSWDDPDSEARKRFEVARQELSQSEEFKKLEESIAASERLTATDFAIRINTRG